MHFEIISGQRKWNEFLESYGKEKKDIYFTSSYAKVHELNGEGEARCCLYLGNNGMKILYPFIITNIPDYGMSSNFYDISSCYGYGGPLVEGFDINDIEEFEKLLHEWCNENNVVAEFIRFHPIFKNHEIFRNNIIIEKNRETVYLDLTKTMEEIWNSSITSKARNQIRKAQKSGVIIRENQSLNSFLDIYHQTMNRLNADDFYYYSNEYFDELSKFIPDNMIVLEALFEERVVAASLFMFMGDYIHYHLSGSLREYLNLCPNNLLIYHAIEYGINKKMTKMHLGGGATNKNDDTLLQFKQNFSKNLSDFYIGKRVHNQRIYEQLMHEWEEKNGKKARIFLQYENN
ncbi:lipid II:glycine glycyltransferase FemX [Acetobacterium woodii]|uniref:BioF2-like acetyltransferase domain-containing protein n=1 Tax=Acetobacterium woodii (strain ATCC 29683 / DSM 1030 / JCM 2381 / KCTC 1655 / WB1) TaxID=931626 RepID=H6LDS9_ACEWD|nr:GNAT family N-acetyltransferase [Acetobacterium woodii]AFA49243.1 hypothetical protein Awo_c24860 [Acetobacterium woodii DSM 1030]